MNSYQKIEQFIVDNQLVKHGEKVVIGLSGGPDSIFLLYFFVALREKYNLTLVAAHLNHEWRTQADCEEQLCREIAQKVGVQFVSGRLSQLQCAVKYDGSKEEYARKMRRFFLEKVAREHGAHHIALGHHAQDQQETFFIRLIRGTSLAGLVGMQPQQGLYIRPLLTISKQEILDWLHAHNISYAVDASNNALCYLRNRIRATVLPALSQSDDRFDLNFFTTLQRLQEDNKLLDEITHETFNQLFVKTDSVYQLNIEHFRATNKRLYYRLITAWLIRENVPFRPTQTFFDEIIRFLLHSDGGVHQLHHQWSIVKKQKKAFILKK